MTYSVVWLFVVGRQCDFIVVLLLLNAEPAQQGSRAGVDEPARPAGHCLTSRTLLTWSCRPFSLLLSCYRRATTTR